MSPTDKRFAFGLAEQKRIRAENLPSFILNAGAFQEAYGASAGSFADVSKEIIRGSADTLGRVSPEEMALQLADVGQKASDAGMSPTQAIAAYTAIARTTKSKRTATARIGDYFEGKYELTGPQATAYAVELPRIQGAPTEDLPDLLGTVPELASGKALEGEQGLLQNQRQKSATRSNLARAVWAGRQRVADSEGFWSATAESMVESTVGPGNTRCDERSAPKPLTVSRMSATKHKRKFSRTLKSKPK